MLEVGPRPRARTAAPVSCWSTSCQLAGSHEGPVLRQPELLHFFSGESSLLVASRAAAPRGRAVGAEDRWLGVGAHLPGWPRFLAPRQLPRRLRHLLRPCSPAICSASHHMRPCPAAPSLTFAASASSAAHGRGAPLSTLTYAPADHPAAKPCSLVASTQHPLWSPPAQRAELRRPLRGRGTRRPSTLDEDGTQLARLCSSSRR